MERHFTVTVAIVYKDRVLLHLHKKMKGMWLFVGGHFEGTELPEEAALREIKEETGLEAELYNSGPTIESNTARYLIQPMHLLLAYVDEHHQHFDLIYYAKAKNDQLNPAEGESQDLKWFTIEDLEKGEIEVPPIAKDIAIKAIKLLGSAEENNFSGFNHLD